MRHWSQLGTRNWRARPGRTLLATLAITLGVAVVVWVTGCYESVQRTITRVVLDWIGRTHVSVESVGGRWDVFADSIAADIAALPETREVATRTMEWIDGGRLRPGDSERTLQLNRLDVTGLDPAHEERFRVHAMTQGRMLRPGDTGCVVAEDSLIESWHLRLDDTLLLKAHDKPAPPVRVRVIGFIDRRRVSAAQLPMLWATIADVQKLCDLPHRIKGVDVILYDASPAGIAHATERIRALAEKHKRSTGETLKVTTTEAQLKKLAAAQGLLQFILLLSAAVLLLTAFFIIAATMNMGLVERIGQIGLLRCVGISRGQVAAVVLLEALPVGLLGLALGIPAGYALQAATIALVPAYVGDMALSRWGVLLAAVGGLGTALLGAAAPAARALTVSPVEAARPLARPVRAIWIALAGLAGLALLAAHQMLLRSIDPAAPRFDAAAVLAIVLMYAGYALLVPAVIVSLGRAAARIAALVLRLRPELLGDEIAKAPWRSAAVCSGLMVGLSLIVGLVVWAESVKAGWQFPKEFPEGLLYSWSGATLADARKLESLTEIKDLVIADDFNFSLRKPGLFNPSVLDKFSRFVAADPAKIPRIVSLTYLEGVERDALAALRRGGSVLITREFSQAQDKHVGQTLTMYAYGRRADFKIAAVIASPAIDIAVNFFNATEYFQIYAVGAVIGTLDDAHKCFGRESAKMLLFNFNLPRGNVESSKSRKAETSALGTAPFNPQSAIRNPQSRVAREHPWWDLSADMAVASPAEQAVVHQMEEVLGPGAYAFATAAQLKRQIDHNLENVTLLLSAIPLMGMIVAALGVGNLMMASVAARRREIAVLRAVGMTRGQILRMIVGEALILGLFGSVIGIGLGLHLGHVSNTLTELLSGYHPTLSAPWPLLALAAALATALCIAAGLLPARMAARSNVVAALQGG